MTDAHHDISAGRKTDAGALDQQILVIRKSGIWNSRSPFNDYLAIVRRIGRVTALLGGGVHELRRIAKAEPNKARTITTAFKATFRSSPDASLYGELYRDQYPSRSSPKPPFVFDLLNDVNITLEFLQERALLARYGAFEQFVHCWFLNIVLATLEKGDDVYGAQIKILDQTLPFSRRYFPDVRTILKAFPGIWNELRIYPRMNFDRSKGPSSSQSVDPLFGALASIMFWRDYRNLHVHGGGFVTFEFHRKHRVYYAECLRSHVGKELEVTAPLPVSLRLTGAMATAMYRVAALLSSHLEAASTGRRGHPEAPMRKTMEYWPSPPRSRPLLYPGDHAPSLQWLEDEAFRASICRERGWTLGPDAEALRLPEL